MWSVAAPAVAVHPDPGMAGSVAVAADVDRAWSLWVLMLPSPVCALSSVPTAPLSARSSRCLS